MSFDASDTSKHRSFPAIVVGAGPAGLTAALSLASSGVPTCCIGPGIRLGANQGDMRTSALMETSVRLLRKIGAWSACEEQSAPLRAIRMIDDTGRLLRAPEVLFRAEELQLQAFGYNVPNAALVDALIHQAGALEALTLVDSKGITDIFPAPDHVNLRSEEGWTADVKLVVGADGRRSGCRTAAGISTTNWAYDQAAIACNFEHSLCHESISNEFHRQSGPLTTVPLPGNASSLVWVERPEEAQKLKALDDAAFARHLETRLYGLLGNINSVSRRAVFPLSGMSVSRLGDRRIALVGEAAHVIPPIGAQGLNLGFRDAAMLTACVTKAAHADDDIGSTAVLSDYANARASDITSRTLAVDLLNRTVLAPFLPMQAARSLGLGLLSKNPYLRKLVMRAGLSPENSLPEDLRTSG